MYHLITSIEGVEGGQLSALLWVGHFSNSYACTSDTTIQTSVASNTAHPRGWSNMAFGFDTTGSEIVDTFKERVAGKTCRW